MVSSQMVASQMVSSQMVSSQMVSSQMVSRQMVSRQMVSRQMVSRQMVSRQMVSSQILPGVLWATHAEPLLNRSTPRLIDVQFLQHPIFHYPSYGEAFGRARTSNDDFRIGSLDGPRELGC